MCSDVDGNGAESGQFRDELAAVLHVGVIRLVVAKVRVDRLKRTEFRTGIYPDRNGLLRKERHRRERQRQSNPNGCPNGGNRIPNRFASLHSAGILYRRFKKIEPQMSGSFNSPLESKVLIGLRLVTDRFQLFSERNLDTAIF